MSIAEDASTPAVALVEGSTAATLTTASFSPPSNSLILVAVNWATWTSPSSSTLTVADSLSNSYAAGAFKFSAVAFGETAFFTYYYTSAPGSITITATNANTQKADMQVGARVLTGASSSQTGAGTFVTFTNSDNMYSTLTTTRAGSWAYVAGVSGAAIWTVESSNTTTINSFNDASPNAGGIIGRQTVATVTPGSSVLGWTQNSPFNFTLCAQEILPPAAAADPRHNYPVAPIFAAAMM